MTPATSLFEINARYCIDTNVIVSFLSESDAEYYSAEMFPSQWALIERLVTSGEIIAPRRVEQELSGHANQNARIGAWLSKNDHMFRDLDAAHDLQFAKRVVNAYSAYANSNNYLGDLEVIALAGARGLTVISLEVQQPQVGARRPKIPNVCAEFKVKCLSVTGFLRAEKEAA